MIIGMIEHECNRNCDKPNNYKKYTNLHPYVENFLHTFCYNKKWIVLNFEAMNTDIRTMFDHHDMPITGGYIGTLLICKFVF